MINLFKINQKKFAKFLLNNIKLAQSKSLERLQADLDYNLSKDKTADQKRNTIVNFLSDEDVRKSLAVIVLTDPDLKFSETAKASAYEQILGVNENKLNKFLETNIDFIEQGSTLKKILVSLLSGKARFERPEYSKVSEEPELERGGPSVEQPDITEDDNKTQIANKLIEYCQSLGIEVPKENQDAIISGDHDREYWVALLSVYRSIAIKTLNAEQFRRVEFITNYLNKNDIEDPEVSANLDRLFDQYIRHQTEKSVKHQKLTDEEKKQIKEQGGKLTIRGKPYVDFFNQMKPDIDALDKILENLRQHVTKQNLFKSGAFYLKNIDTIYEKKQLVGNFINQEQSYIEDLMKLFREISFHALILTEQINSLLSKTRTTLPKLHEQEGKYQGAGEIHEVFYMYQKILVERIDEINKEQQEFKKNLLLITSKFYENIQSSGSDKARDYYRTNISKDKFKHLYAVFLNSKLTGLSKPQLANLNADNLIEEFLQIYQTSFDLPKDTSEEHLKQYALNAIKLKIDSLEEPMLQGQIDGNFPYPSMEKYPLSEEEFEKWKSKNDNKKVESDFKILLKKYAPKYSFTC